MNNKYGWGSIMLYLNKSVFAWRYLVPPTGQLHVRISSHERLLEDPC